MFAGKKVVVVMPAYNAAQTLRKTYEEVMAQGVVDRVIVVDDASRDETAALARTLPGVRVHRHPENRGYGANQKTCYRIALEEGADIVIMVHPDYQYTPKLIPAMASLIGSGLYECVLGSRILGGHALRHDLVIGLPERLRRVVRGHDDDDFLPCKHALPWSGDAVDRVDRFAGAERSSVWDAVVSPTTPLWPRHLIL